MKTSTKCRLLAVLFFVFAALNPVTAWAQGTIIPNSIIFYQPGAAPPGTYLYSTAYPAGENAGFFVLSLTTTGVGQYQMGYYGIAELYSVHAATTGMALTPNYVAGATPLLSNNNNPGSYSFSLGVGQSMLFAYWDDALWVPEATHGVPDIYDAYGWFRLTRQVSGLVIADSATALGGGIIAGTYTAVPEPTSLAIGLVGVVGLILRRR